MRAPATIFLGRRFGTSSSNPNQRRRGLGRAFAQAIVARLREQGIGQIDLNVREDNPRALAFWRSCGFSLALYRLRMYL
jgi:ribosomal protein S18 acetylase RimI-like enzyme